MKITIAEFRDMVAEAVRRTVNEAKKKTPKLVAARSEESRAEEWARRLKAQPGYTHARVLDMSAPLGDDSLPKRQGAANMGGWTSESRRHESIRALVRMIVREEIRTRRGR